MHEFKPRGIIKWSPFSALSNYQDEVEKLNKELDRIDGIKRSKEFLAFIDEELAKYIPGDDINITYTMEQEILNIYGSITKLTNEYIVINEQKINKLAIIDIIL